MRRPIFSAALAICALAAANATAQTPQDHPAGALCRESGPLPLQIRCFLDAAESERDAGLCEGAYDFAVRFNCISLFAEHSGDPVSCERIPIRNNRLLLMRDSCIGGVAAATRMPQLCEQVQLAVIRDTCFLRQVVEFNAVPELCQRISRATVKASCLAPQADPK